MGTTTNFGLEYPEGSDDVDIANDIKTLADDVDATIHDNLIGDTGWRIMPVQSWTIDYTGQTGVPIDTRLVMRRTGNLVFAGVTVKVNTATRTATAGSGTGQSRALELPEDHLFPRTGTYSWLPGLMAVYTPDPSVATDTTACTLTVKRTAGTGAVQANLTMGFQLVSSTSTVVNGVEYFVRGYCGPIITDDPWPETLPGEAYTPV